mmetsp:Transcript_1152/g.3183  ORF Transcript_1152/g.3183 Transcript_1152/m.3183 type:complete len:336 (+) Transcript_1152:81-1088(+)
MAVDATAAFRESVRRRRVTLGQPTPAHEVIPKPRERSAFGEEARRTLQKIHSTARFLQDSHEAYLMEDGLHGMSDVQRDEVDAETQRFLQICGERIESLKLSATAQAAETLDNGRPAVSAQLRAHRQATLQLLYDQLKRVTSVFDEHRGHRLRQVAEARDQRLGAAAEAAGSFGQGGALAPSLSSSNTESLALGASLGRLGGSSHEPTTDADNLTWGDAEVLEDEILDQAEQAQLQTENEALQKELETMVEQAREAESRMLEISQLSHSFATKVEEQSSEVETLFEQAEQTSENLVRGNAYLDSAAKHSRDFRLIVLVVLMVSSFCLLFLDWYYD